MAKRWLYRDHDFYDLDRDERATGSDIYSSEAPYVPLHRKSFNTSRPTTPAAASSQIHLEPAAGSIHERPGGEHSSAPLGPVAPKSTSTRPARLPSGS